MSADNADRAYEAEMLAALAEILRRGEFVVEEVEALVAVASDTAAEAGSRTFAHRSLRWLARQSAFKAFPLLWRQKQAARH